MTLPELNIWELVVLGIASCAWLYELYFYIRYMAGILRQERRNRRKARQAAPTPAPTADTTTDSEQPIQWPGVSVIVCAKNQEDNLHNYLQALLSQQYPQFEVIVVNDGSLDNTKYVLDYYNQQYTNLKVTFVPEQAWVRSSKKLALTLAAKAAQYDYLLLTDADCRPESNRWIHEMMSAFVESGDQTEIVLGYGAYYQNQSRINTRIQFDTLTTAMQYMGMAASRHPYMGIGRNLAYRKSTFFEHAGFQGLLGQKAGDDDLFVNKVANRYNTRIVVSPESVTWAVPERTARDWRLQKYRNSSVAPMFKWTTRLRLAIEPCARVLLYASLVAAVTLAILGYTHWLLIPIILLLMIIRGIWQTAIINRTARHFQASNFGMGEVTKYDILLPIIKLSMRIRHAINRKNEIKWN